MNKLELWLPVNYNNRYQISNLGRVKRDSQLIEIKKDTSRNYVHINGKTNISKLVATHFVYNDDPINKTRIVNIDKNNFNNNAENLRWDKPPEIQSNHKFKTDMNKPIFQYDLKMNLIKKWKNLDSIVKQNKYNTGHLYKCLNGRNTSAYGFIWKYKDKQYEEIELGEDEEFKNIGTFNNIDLTKYEISNYGKIRNARKTFILKTKYNTMYEIIDIANNDNTSHYIIPIHELVAYVFLKKESDNDNIIIHKDGNLHNNYSKNLKYVTKKGLILYENEKCKYLNKLELWLPILGYNGYIISSLSRIKSLYTGKILSSNENTSYDMINLQDEKGIKKNLRIHRLVATAFCYNSDPINNKIVDHIDNIKKHNMAENLRWVTYKQNSQYYHQYFKKPMYKPILQYDKDMNFIKEWNNINEIYDELQYDKTNIKSCMDYKYQYAYDFIWRYKYTQIKDQPNIQEDEVLKNVGIFEGKDFSNYEVSNCGNVKSLKKKYYFTLNKQNDYYIVGLTNKLDKKQYRIKVHRLVAHCFVEGRTDEKKIVNHKDEDKLNPKFDNLEWVTAAENTIYSKAIKVNQICIETGKILNTFNSVAEAQRTLNLKSNISIWKCISGKYTHGYGYRWETV